MADQEQMSPELQAFMEQEQQRMMFQQWITCAPVTLALTVAALIGTTLHR